MASIDTQRAYGLDSDGGERLLWMGEPTLLKATEADTGGAYSLVEVYANHGEVPLHSHTHEDEAFYILEGDITFEVGDQTIEAGPGSFVFGPRGVPHRYTVTSPNARMLMLFSPSGFERFIRATSVPTDSLERPDPDEIEIDWEQVASAAAAYGGKLLE